MVLVALVAIVVFVVWMLQAPQSTGALGAWSVRVLLLALVAGAIWPKLKSRRQP